MGHPAWCSSLLHLQCPAFWKSNPGSCLPGGAFRRCCVEGRFWPGVYLAMSFADQRSAKLIAKGEEDGGGSQERTGLCCYRF